MLIVETQTVNGNLFAVRKAEAVTLYRAGKLTEARSLILSLFSVAQTDDERLALFNNWAMIERGMKNHTDAFSIYAWAGHLLDESVTDFQKGNYYFGRAVNYEETGEPGKALIDYSAARFYYEEGKHFTYLRSVENNTAWIIYKAGKPDEALSYLRSARKCLEGYGEPARAAEIDNTIAEILSDIGEQKTAFESVSKSILALSSPAEKLALSKSIETCQKILERMKSS